MEKSPLFALLTDQLRDLYDAEKQLIKALPAIAKAVDDEELAQGFRDHAAQTQGQAQRIEQIFQTLGMKARGKPCEAMKGLIQEGKEVISNDDLDDSVRDIALVAAGRRVEHYEMAAYDSLVTAARAAKQTDVAQLLEETLHEETATDKLLAGIGKRLLKAAVSSAPAEAPEPKAKKTGARGQKKHGEGNGHLSHVTTEHDEIRRWAEERGGKPACVRGTGDKGDIGLMRLEFPGKPNAQDDKLAEISWEEFFEKFDERELALVYQERTADGELSYFNKLVAREGEAKPKARAAR